LCKVWKPLEEGRTDWARLRERCWENISTQERVKWQKDEGNCIMRGQEQWWLLQKV
jgi:hypothetical protein